MSLFNPSSMATKVQYLHQSTYGHAGGLHTAKPVMAIHNNNIYNIQGGKLDLAKPVYHISNGKAFATEFHPNGASPHAMFEIRGNKVHTTINHPEHNPDMHAFEIRSGTRSMA